VIDGHDENTAEKKEIHTDPSLSQISQPPSCPNWIASQAPLAVMEIRHVEHDVKTIDTFVDAQDLGIVLGTVLHDLFPHSTASRSLPFTYTL